jgi:hypothetical protein
MSKLSAILKILATLSLLLGLAQVVSASFRVELFRLPPLHLKLIGAGLVLLAIVLGTADYLTTRRPRPTPPANVVSGRITTGGGDVSITQQTVEKMEIHQGDTAEEKARKRAQAQRIVAESILTTLHHIDQRLISLDVLSATDTVGRELKGIRHRLAPALQESAREGYRRVMAEQRAASLQQAFNGTPVRSDQGEAMFRLLQETGADPAPVGRFNEAVEAFSETSQKVVEATRAPAMTVTASSEELQTRIDKVQTERLDLACEAMSNQAQIAHVQGLLVLEALQQGRAAIDSSLSTLAKLSPRALIKPSQAQPLLADLARNEEARIQRKAQLLGQQDAAVRNALNAYARLERELRIAPTDSWETVVAKAVSLRQLGRNGDAVAAFAQYGRMFRDRDLGAERYASTAQQFSVKMKHLDVNGGVYVFEIRGGEPAAGYGLRVGDIVVELAGKPTTNMVEFTDALSHLPSGKSALLVHLRLERSGTFTRHETRVTDEPLSAGFMPI